MNTPWTSLFGGCLVACLGPVLADEPADGRNTPVERLEYLKVAMKSYDFSRAGDTPAAIKVQPDPVFRFGRPSVDLLDGAVFLFTDDVGRPEAAMQPFLKRSSQLPQGRWIHEFTSLSTGPIVAKRDGKPRWYPAGSGLEFRPVPDAPKPAATPAARLRQMRAVADEFHADDDFRSGGWRALRMLTTPIARYGKVGAIPEDGALFAFVEETDPEVFLFVEVRKGPNGPEWQYGLAPMGCWAVKVKLKGREVWKLPLRSVGDPTKPLYNYQFWP